MKAQPVPWHRTCSPIFSDETHDITDLFRRADDGPLDDGLEGRLDVACVRPRGWIPDDHLGAQTFESLGTNFHLKQALVLKIRMK